MSDTQQGPDWWVASDGKWYPPVPDDPSEDPPVEEPAGSEKKGLLGKAAGAAKAAAEKGMEKRAQTQERVAAVHQEHQEANAAYRQWLIESGQLFEYGVAQIRFKLVGDKVDTAEVQRVLNGWAQKGWHVRSITDTQVGGRVGPGGVSGLLVVFERQVSQ